MGCNELGSSRGQKRNERRVSDQVLKDKSLNFRNLSTLILLVVIMIVDRTNVAFGQMLDDQKIGDIRTSIVEALGLQRIPDPAKANVSQAEYERAHNEYLTRLRRSTTRDDDVAQERKLFTMYAQDEVTQEGIRLSFPMSIENHENALVESGILRLLLDHEEEDSMASELQIRIYRKRALSARQRLLTKRTIREPESVRRRWLEFDITDEVAAAAGLNSDEPLQLLVQVLSKDYTTDTLRPARGFGVNSPALNVHAIYLPAAEQHPYNSRTKRSSARDVMSIKRGHRTACRSGAKKCCRHEMNVNFGNLEGFDFIIRPTSFDAGFCKGRCPPRFNPAHHHALIQSLIWKDNRTVVPKPCCAPSKLADLEILYYDEKDTTKLKVSDWKDMTVIACACS